MYTSRTSSKGQIVIPKELRDKLGIKAGSRVAVSLAADHVAIYPLPEDPVEAYSGVFEEGSSLTGALVSERKKEGKLEEEKSAGRIRAPGVSKGRKTGRARS
jgi:AbrB family looped-hinge helix DNA binding protein